MVFIDTDILVIWTSINSLVREEDYAEKKTDNYYTCVAASLPQVKTVKTQHSDPS